MYIDLFARRVFRGEGQSGFLLRRALPVAPQTRHSQRRDAGGVFCFFFFFPRLNAIECERISMLCCGVRGSFQHGALELITMDITHSCLEFSL